MGNLDSYPYKSTCSKAQWLCLMELLICFILSRCPMVPGDGRSQLPGLSYKVFPTTLASVPMNISAACRLSRYSASTTAQPRMVMS